MKTLLIDIETTPNLAHVWSLWQQNVGLSQLLESAELLCFAAKWHGAKRVEFASQFHDGKHEMVERAHRLLDEADVVMHYNGTSFDMPHLNREFVQSGMEPPSPYKQVDLLRAVKRRFRFPSNKLDYVLRALDLPGKVGHAGHELWVKCMAGDPKAWNQMRRYNRRDVTALEDLAERLRPWIPGLPNAALYSGEGHEDACPGCGSTELEKRGYAYTQTSAFQQYKCKGCGRWCRGGKALFKVDLREVAQ